MLRYFRQTESHRMSMELSCNNLNDPFRVEAESIMSSTLQNLDLSADVWTPFMRWDKKAFKLKLKKTGGSIEASLSAKRKNKNPETYTLLGSSEYDLVSNMINFYDSKLKLKQ